MFEPGWRLTADQQRQMRLLLWLADHSGDFKAPQEVYREAVPNQPGSESFADLDGGVLSRAGLLFASPANEAFLMRATDDGGAEARSILARREDRRVRRKALKSSILLWLERTDARDASTRIRGGVGDFTVLPDNFFWGTSFPFDEIVQAMTTLADSGFIGRLANVSGVSVQPWITEKGIRCVERFDGDTEQFEDALAAQPIHQNTFNAQNLQVAQGDRNRLTMNVQVDGEHLALLAKGVGEILVALRIADAHEADTYVDDAVKDLQSPTPTGSGFRHLMNWSKDKAGAGSTLAITAAVSALADEGTQQLLHYLGSR